jgi:hypothetical protein
MNIITSSITAAIAFALTAGAAAPALAGPMAGPLGHQAGPAVEQVQYDGSSRRHGDRRDRFERRGNSVYFNNRRGFGERRPGYRQYNGFWFPPAAFIAGVIIGGSLDDGPRQRRNSDRPLYRFSADHVDWCSDRWRSYRASDNSYQPSKGGRRACTSPFG